MANTPHSAPQMTPEKQTLLLIQGAIYRAPEADRLRVEQLAQQVRTLVRTHGDHGVLAVALVSAEMAAED